MSIRLQQLNKATAFVRKNLLHLAVVHLVPPSRPSLQRLPRAGRLERRCCRRSSQDFCHHCRISYFVLPLPGENTTTKTFAVTDHATERRCNMHRVIIIGCQGPILWNIFILTNKSWQHKLQQWFEAINKLLSAKLSTCKLRSIRTTTFDEWLPQVSPDVKIKVARFCPKIATTVFT